MQLEPIKISVVFAQLLLIVAIFTANWSKIEISGPTEKGIVTYGLFNMSWIDDDVADVIASDLLKCRILVIIAFCIMVLADDYIIFTITGCVSKHIRSIMLIVSSILLISGLIIWSNKVSAKISAALLRGSPNPTPTMIFTYGYSYYLVIASVVLTMASGLNILFSNIVNKES